MLSIEALDVILTIGEGELIEGIIVTLLASPALIVFFEKYPRLKKAVVEDLPRWREQLKNRLKVGQVPEALKQELSCYQQSQVLSTNQLALKMPEITALLAKLNSPFMQEANTLLAQSPAMTAASHTLFLQRWRLSLILHATLLSQQVLEDERDKLLAEIHARMALSGQLDTALVENDSAAGKLWDMSRHTLRYTDYQLIVQYGDFLASQPELIALAGQLGRSQEAKSVPRDHAPVERWRIQVREPAHMPEQVDGLQLGDDILRLLPTELATLGITELEYEFYRRLVEKQLLNYRLHGDSWREKVIERPVIHQNFDKQPRGPFIICVDASGSMGGFNEQCAKAFCLALMRIALADNRRCFINMFSHDVIHYEVSGSSGIEQAIRFLSQRFNGGTDLAKCLHSVAERMKGPLGRDADAVIISDFIAQRLPDDIVNTIKELQRQHQHRFHAVAMSTHGKPSIMRIFDYIWRFDTGVKGRLLRHLKRY